MQDHRKICGKTHGVDINTIPLEKQYAMSVCWNVLLTKRIWLTKKVSPRHFVALSPCPVFRCFDWLSRKCVSFLTLSMFSGFSQNSRSSTVFCLLAFSNKHRTPFREKTKTTKIHGKQKQDMTLGETICPVSINCSCVFSCPRVLFLWLARVFPQMHDEFAGQHHTQKKCFLCWFWA